VILASLLLLCQSARIEEIAGSANGRVGAAAAIVESGQQVIAYRASDTFPMQSVYKTPIAMAVLDRVASGALRLQQRIDVSPDEYVPRPAISPLRDAHPRGATVTIRALIDHSVRSSDGSASDVLLRLAGGADAVNHYLARVRVRGVTIATTETAQFRDPPLQYRNSASPAGMIALLSALHRGDGLTRDHRALLLDMMARTNTGKARLKGQLPPKTVVAHKTGTSMTIAGVTAATNDTGLITLPDGRHLAVAVFVSDSKARDATRDAVIAKIARAAWDCVSK
jgi:beta-lactamase class A